MERVLDACPPHENAGLIGQLEDGSQFTMEAEQFEGLKDIAKITVALTTTVMKQPYPSMDHHKAMLKELTGLDKEALKKANRFIKGHGYTDTIWGDGESVELRLNKAGYAFLGREVLKKQVIDT